MPRTVTIRHALKQVALGLLGMLIAWAVPTAIIAVGMTALDDVSAKLEEGHVNRPAMLTPVGRDRRATLTP